MAANDINPKTKVSVLVNKGFQVLGMLERMGITDNFGERTVEETCERHSMDPDTFIMLYNIFTDDAYRPSEKMLREGSIDDIVRYLHLSHEYYLNVALQSLSDVIENLITPLRDSQKAVFWKFFTDYETELRNHFDFEETQVMPYVESLLEGNARRHFTIDSFEEDHNSINEKISDLKNLVMNSLPEGCDSGLKMQALYQICALEYDINRHTLLEDEVLVPMVRNLENRGSRRAGVSGVEEEEKEVLSEREKEILIGVAKGLLNKEIADEYNISINTVITHRKNITRKTGIKSVAGLTVYALLNGLIEMGDVE